MSYPQDDSPLGSTIRPWLQQYRDCFGEALDKSKALARTGLSILTGLEIHVDSLRQVVVSALLARCLEHYEAVVLLTDRGMLVPAQVALRALIEALFTLGALAKDDTTLDSYVQEDLIQRRKLTKKLREVADPRFNKHIDPQLETELEAEIKKVGASELNTKSLAERAGLKDWYLVAYALLTGPAHTKIRDLHDYLQFERGTIVGFSFQRCDVDLAGTLSAAGIAFVLALDYVTAEFGRGLADQRESTLQYFLDLGNHAGNDVEKGGV